MNKEAKEKEDQVLQIAITALEQVIKKEEKLLDSEKLELLKIQKGGLAEQGK